MDSADPAPWSVAALVLIPLLGAVALWLLHRPRGIVAVIAVATTLITAAAALDLAVRVTTLGPLGIAVGGWSAPLGIKLYADALAVVLLVLTAIVMVLVNLYAASEESSKDPVYWPTLYALWTGLNVLFLSGDIFNLYVALEIVSLAAVVLVALARTPVALQAALRYLLYALFGSLAFLLGVALLYTHYGTLDLAELATVVEPEPVAWLAWSAVIGGLLIKTALFPLHSWLPAAHSSAPAAVSALLSGLVVKTGIYLLWRLSFWTFDALMTPAAQQFLGALGAFAVVYGSLLALQQARLKRLVAYSTVAQLGYLMLLLSLGPHAWTGALLFLLSHGLAKTALFLATGNVVRVFGHDRLAELHGGPPNLALTGLTIGICAVAIAGLPPSAGFIAKWLLIESALAQGQWWWSVPLIVGSLLGAAYMLHAVRWLFIVEASPAQGGDKVTPPLGPVHQGVPMALALAALGLGLLTAPLAGVFVLGEPPGEPLAPGSTTVLANPEVTP
ncbi:MAG: complex I subunit 5 family protein [Candidatus Competibacterales bacterium]